MTETPPFRQAARIGWLTRPFALHAGNRAIDDWEKSKHDWTRHAANAQIAAKLEEVAKDAFVKRVPLSFPNVTLRPMDVRTFLATFETK